MDPMECLVQGLLMFFHYQMCDVFFFLFFFPLWPFQGGCSVTKPYRPICRRTPWLHWCVWELSGRSKRKPGLDHTTGSFFFSINVLAIWQVARLFSRPAAIRWRWRSTRWPWTRWRIRWVSVMSCREKSQYCSRHVPVFTSWPSFCLAGGKIPAQKPVLARL